MNTEKGFDRYKVAEVLADYASDYGVVAALELVFGKSVSVSVAYSRSACDITIDEMEFSVRATNSLKRAGLFTIGEIVDMITSEKLKGIRNLGAKTENEIKTRLLVLGYEKLNDHDKVQFFMDALSRNEIKK